MQAWQASPIPTLPGRGGPLRLLDTATGQVRESTPGRTAGMYVCGITPYDATHMGHAATYVAFDLVHRVWRDAGHDVHYVQNITDVDDPLLERARATGVDWQDLAAEQIDLFRADMAALNVLPPTDYVGAVESIPDVVTRIEELSARGAVYQLDGDLYFAVDSDPSFGSVSGWERERMIAVFAERGGDPDRPGKVNPLDCLLWLAARPGEPAWQSALGEGRPGWHIECVAIALGRLGMSFDVQGGGSDLVFPHHEMCASQAQVIEHAWPYARHYVHAGMVGWQGAKMSKSRGNLVFVSQLRQGGDDPMAIRLAILAHRYRTDWAWTPQGLDGATQRLARWREAASAPATLDIEPFLRRLRSALADDLDTPAALDVVDTWAHRTLDVTRDVRPATTVTEAAADVTMGDAVHALLGVTL